MSADDVYRWANLILLISLIAGVIATYAIVQSGKRRDEQSKRDLADAGGETARAHERAAQLEKDAAVARLETERLKQASAWREISKAQHSAITESLRGKIKGKVWVEVVKSDPEAVNFHAGILQTLKDAGVETHYFSGWERAVGLQITNVKSDDARAIRQAFDDVGIRFEETEEGLLSASADVEIIVGSKAPLLFTNRYGTD